MRPVVTARDRPSAALSEIMLSPPLSQLSPLERCVKYGLIRKLLANPAILISRNNFKINLNKTAILSCEQRALWLGSEAVGARLRAIASRASG